MNLPLYSKLNLLVVDCTRNDRVSSKQRVNNFPDLQVFRFSIHVNNPLVSGENYKIRHVKKLLFDSVIHVYVTCVFPICSLFFAADTVGACIRNAEKLSVVSVSS